MILYHGSYSAIEHPDISFSRDYVDFGKGFYTTPIKEQAEKWCQRFIRKNKKGVVSKYVLDDSIINKLKVLEFVAYDDKWLDFILNCRSGKDQSDYDIVIGGVANDKVFNTVELYFDGLIDKKEAIKRLTYEKINLQVCIRNQEVIDRYLVYKGSEEHGS